VSLTGLLVDHRMCLACLAAKVGMSADTAEVTLTVMQRGLPIRRQSRTCPFCGVLGAVYSLDPPRSSAGRQ
jgi:hypothetical protein